jgi:hypothetical protein
VCGRKHYITRNVDSIQLENAFILFSGPFVMSFDQGFSFTKPRDKSETTLGLPLTTSKHFRQTVVQYVRKRCGTIPRCHGSAQPHTRLTELLLRANPLPSWGCGFELIRAIFFSPPFFLFLSGFSFSKKVGKFFNYTHERISPMRCADAKSRPSL